MFYCWFGWWFGFQSIYGYIFYYLKKAKGTWIPNHQPKSTILLADILQRKYACKNPTPPSFRSKSIVVHSAGSMTTNHHCSHPTNGIPMHQPGQVWPAMKPPCFTILWFVNVIKKHYGTNPYNSISIFSLMPMPVVGMAVSVPRCQLESLPYGLRPFENQKQEPWTGLGIDIKEFNAEPAANYSQLAIFEIWI